MSQDLEKLTLEELENELGTLGERRAIDAKALEKARLRATGNQIGPSSQNLASALAEDLKELEKDIAGIETEIAKRRKVAP
jgi:hypothetical protein